MKAKMLPVLALSCFASMHASAQAKPDYHLLVAMNSQKCAHVQAGSQDDGGWITQWQCRNLKKMDPEPYFQWDKVDVGGGYFMLRAKHSGKCAQVNGASSENGALITQWGCQKASLHFHWKQELAENRAGDLYHYIVNRASSKCMHVHGGGKEDGALITQWDCVNQPNVKWMVIARGGIHKSVGVPDPDHAADRSAWLSGVASSCARPVLVRRF